VVRENTDELRLVGWVRVIQELSAVAFARFAICYKGRVNSTCTGDGSDAEHWSYHITTVPAKIRRAVS